MISTLAQTTLVFVEEAQAHDVALGGGGDVDLVNDVPCIHATRIDVMINSDEPGDLKIVMYSASKALSVTTTLGAVAAATTTEFVFGGGANEVVGQVYDLVFTPTAPAPADTATVWTAARS